MASIPVDTERFGVLRVDSVAPKVDGNGAQKVDKSTGMPLWVVRVLRRPPVGRSAFVNITVPSASAPALKTDAYVTASGLMAFDYAIMESGRHGIYFRADSIEEVI